MSMSKLITIAVTVAIGINLFKAPVPFETTTIEERAEMAGMTVEDFVFISSVVEAESDRSESLDGRILIALTIINRVEDPRFPDTISEVLTAPGQFSTVRNGHSIVDRTDYSDEAVIRAVEWNEAGDDPNVLFFNCIGYGIGEPYGLIDGNYFTTMEVQDD
jgi:N-acetylmuramoyl-L-alanine amidase